MKQSKIAILSRIPANPISALLSAFDSAGSQLKQQGARSADAYELSFPQTIYEQKVQTTIGIDKHSYLLDWVEVKHSHSQDIYKAMWGNPLQRFDYSGWLLDGSGLSVFPSKVESHHQRA